VAGSRRAASSVAARSLSVCYANPEAIELGPLIISDVSSR
jgi:hypothetical protein